MMSTGLLPPLRHGESAVFAATMAALMWMYKKGPPQVTVAVEVSNACTLRSMVKIWHLLKN